MDNKNHEDMEKILKAFKRMNIEINCELQEIKQQSNRRLLAMETQMDSIEKSMLHWKEIFEILLFFYHWRNDIYLS
ncbi:hypothetical protein [Psychrobacillus psychrotolerans]|uniref:hypothetical protein n=1 Tax=Psychrobacillus psychrotolerans TaxID=126156 RepID=UPI003315921F